jgi:hypothetical protein
MCDDGPYHDAHGVVFTANSFRLILHHPKTFGCIQIEELRPPGLFMRSW